MKDAGSCPRSLRSDPLQELGRALGFERLNKLQDLIFTRGEEFLDKSFHVGTKVMRARHNKFSKLDTSYHPKVLTLVASFDNGTCQLADKNGRLLKRRTNMASLRRFRARTGQLGIAASDTLPSGSEV
ncbi:hypothetical protein BD770DRAFT_448382 [Pilaira anomala]|nr:hypothetical protein BD770DRAFT_448382 [Pilaira anomala]